jgi:AbrB family looped-hinge helix DNA binding protein
MKTQMSKVSSKWQTTIPSEVREELGLKPGDLIQYSLDSGKLILRKISIEDVVYLKSIEKTLNEWEGDEDDGLL